ncbi:hypothetical protein HY643_04465 [Candidatus Woesearchaeota archaeon]|nr:hypothetical protein [Candidatus Woesearchaeota archaeon]
MKKIIGVWLIFLVLAIFLIGCRKAEQTDESTKTGDSSQTGDESVEDIGETNAGLDAEEQDLNTTEIDGFEKDLSAFEW